MPWLYLVMAAVMAALGGVLFGYDIGEYESSLVFSFCYLVMWSDPVVNMFYYTTQAVRGPITKINQSKCSITGPIFSKYWTGHCPE